MELIKITLWNRLKGLKNKLNVLLAQRYKHIYLPRFRSNENLSDDDAYINSALQQIESLQKYCVLTHKTRILDFGCGQGRLANGLLFTNPDIGYYCGIDTDINAIKWCKRWIMKYHNNFSFIHVNAHNARYNPTAEFRPALPISANSFDIAFLNSVFSHMLVDDIQYYLQQLRQSLNNQGIIYLTAFIEENVPEVEENPINYLNKASIGALHRVRYEKSFFFEMVENIGFEIKDFLHQEINRTKQSVIVAFKTGNPN